MTTIKTLAETLGDLYARIPLGMRLGLGPMQAACTRADNPERLYEVVHIGGTNGKGSTAAMVESIARASGLRTGLYTSPHLCRFAERIRIDGAPVDDATLKTLLEEAMRLGDDLSFFETATLAAFLAFREANVDLAVIEVGIGGRLDATNVVPNPRCCAITSVAFDHKDKLGDTLEAIAREKAGIAKPGVPIVLGRMTLAAHAAASEAATAAGARIVEAVPLPPRITLALPGTHQRENAGVAWTIADVLDFPPDARESGLTSARWPGRLESITVTKGPFAGPWILDGAHNPDGMEALVRSVATQELGAVVFGALADKEWREMLAILKAIRAPRFYVTPPGRTPADPAELAMVAKGRATDSLTDGLTLARRVAADKPIVVCGSLYLIGETRAMLLGLPVDPPVAL